MSDWQPMAEPPEYGERVVLAGVRYDGDIYLSNPVTFSVEHTRERTDAWDFWTHFMDPRE